MRKSIFMMCVTVLIVAGCAKETAPETVNDYESSAKKAMLANAGETIQIAVTLPQVEGLETRVGLTENTSGGFDPSWQDGDAILVGDQTFTLVSADGKKGTFSGKMPSGETFDIVYPAVPYEGELSQKADKDYSHIRYSAAIKGVDSLDDIHFSHGWAGSHGGTFVQSGALKIVLNLPEGAADVTKVMFSVADIDLSVAVENGALTGSSFTAYIPCGEIVLDRGKEVEISVLTSGDAAFKNTFYPGSQTLYEGYLVKLVTSASKWQKVLSGQGSEYDPYLVSTPSELNNIRNLISKNTYTYFKLTADVDMSTITDWQPINLVNEPYGIVFDGGNHKIKGFKCTNGTWASFFGVLHGAVKNLTFETAEVSTTTGSPCGVVAAWVGNIDGTLQGRLENVKVVSGKVSNSSGSSYVGGLSGRSGAGTFVNCSFDGVVERTVAATFTNTYYPVGGILGEALDGVSFTECSTSGTLTTASGRACGGIVGLCSKAMDITDCSSTMNITARDDVAGGIVGYYGTGTISGCHVKSNITVTENGSSISYVGGVAGHTSGAVVITECTYSGALSAFKGVVGGILGQCNTSTGTGCTITKCVTSGTAKATDTVGGILGRASNQGLSVTDCGSSMDISATSSNIGGIVGDLPQNATVKNCCATGKVSGSFALGGIVGRAFGRQNSSASLDTDVKCTIENCIAYNSSISTTVSGGEDPASHYSGGAVVGCSSRPNTLKNCWRKNDLSFSFYSDASLNVLSDHADASPTSPLTQSLSTAKWYSPYHGKAAAAGATLSSVAQSAGWSSEIWDFSGSVPVLK